MARRAVLLAAGLLLPSAATASHPNLLANGELDSSLAGWAGSASSTGSASWATADAAGSPFSGSARLAAAAGENVFLEGPCTLLSPGETLTLEAEVWVDELAAVGNLFVSIDHYGDPTCQQLQSSVSEDPEGDLRQWQPLAVQSSGPAGAVAARPHLVVFGGASLPTVGYFDRLRLRLRRGACLPSAAQLCLNDGRFAVRAIWLTGDGFGDGRAVPFSADSGSFWFFSPTNLELDVKVLDACALNQRFWVFAAGLTDVEVRLEVADTETGAQQVYFNPPGRTFVTVTDTDAFATCP